MPQMTMECFQVIFKGADTTILDLSPCRSSLTREVTVALISTKNRIDARYREPLNRVRFSFLARFNPPQIIPAVSFGKKP
jgi:hypothetical protein